MRKELEFLVMIVVQGVDSKVRNGYNRICNWAAKEQSHKKYIKLWI